MHDRLRGYRGELRKLLSESGAEIGDDIEIEVDGRRYRGILLPRSELEDPRHVVIKLPNGYNIGVRAEGKARVRILAKRRARLSPPRPSKGGGRSDLPKVVILGVGGTIASRVDYTTGAVTSVCTPDELIQMFPELEELAQIETKIILNKYSEHLTPGDWEFIAKEVWKLINEGIDGVVIMHGTDTMHFTSAALSFALRNLPVPVILVGSQRSSDRPSSDAALNLIYSVKFAGWGPLAEVALAMHETTSDTSVVFHRGTRVRKNHTSRRDAFQTIDAPPLARIVDGKIEVLSDDARRRDKSRKPELAAKFEEKAALIKFHPGFNPRILELLVDEGYKGIVIEGTGLGHVGEYVFDSIRSAIERGVLIFMTSQCIWGRVNMRVYDTGRLLLKMGVIPLENMLAETALVKLMWALGQTSDPEEVKKVMLSNLAGEITSSSPVG